MPENASSSANTYYTNIYSIMQQNTKYATNARSSYMIFILYIITVLREAKAVGRSSRIGDHMKRYDLVIAKLF